MKRHSWLGIAVPTVVVVGVTGLAAGGCGGDDSSSSDTSRRCTAGAIECLGDSLVRECPEEGANWVTYSCGSDESCVDGSGCDGGCNTAGEATCLADNVARVCDGARWVTTVCNGGEKCSDGACSPTFTEHCTPDARQCLTDTLLLICNSEGTIWHEVPCGLGCENGECNSEICTPDSTECATEEVRRVCSSTGDGYWTWPCPEGQVCEEGACVFDVQQRCVPNTTQCFENELFTCVDDGTGWGRDACPGGTWCDANAGACMGSVCAPGATRCEGELLATCADDGDSWAVTGCDTPQRCVVVHNKARCSVESPPCALGEVRCGDVANGGHEVDLFSRCEAVLGAPFGQDWVLHFCDESLSCDPENPGCSWGCQPGSSRCRADGIELCDDEGQWTGDIVECAGDTTCTHAVPGSVGALCANVACAQLAEQASLLPSLVSYEDHGVCTDGKIRRCNTAGELGVAASCVLGSCSTNAPPFNSEEFLYGLGACTDEPECEGGEERCVLGATSLFQRCENGTWSSTYEPCGQPCETYTDNSGLTKTLCGDEECVPASTRCPDLGAPEIQTCDDDGTWGEATVCPTGVCRRPPGYDQSVCIDECLPGEMACGGDSMVASDGYHSGHTHVTQCTNGRFSFSTDDMHECEGTTTCRTVGGVALGCLECIGGRNEEGIADTRCTANRRGVDWCSDNSWSTVDCATDAGCVVDGPGALCRTGLVYSFGEALGDEWVTPAEGTNGNSWTRVTSIRGDEPSTGTHLLVSPGLLGGATLQLTLDFPSGGLFWFDVLTDHMTRNEYYPLRVYIDDEVVLSIPSGDSGHEWVTVSPLVVEAGTHTFVWEYSYPIGTVISGRAAIDRVVAVGAEVMEDEP